jgi:hypothetical protein
MLVVSALQARDPMVLDVLMKRDDAPFHRGVPNV